MLELALAQPAVAPGQTIEGVITVTEQAAVRAVRVELVSVEQSSGGPRSLKVMAATVAADAGEHPVGAQFPFSLVAPGAIGPAITGSHGMRRWVVQAVADRPGADKRSEAGIEILPPPPDLPLDQLAVAAHVDDLAALHHRRRRFYGFSELIIPVAFVLIGLVMIVVGGVWLVDPPEAYERGLTPALIMWGIGGFIALMGALGALRYRPRRLAGVTFAPATPAVRRGHTLAVTVTVPERGAMVAQLRGVEYWDIQRRSGNQSQYYTRDTAFFATSHALAPGVNEVSVTVPADALPSYPGSIWRIAYSLEVLPAARVDKRRLLTPRVDTPVLVLP